MKIKKLISAIASLSMVATILSSFTVAHAAAPALTATATYDDANSRIEVKVSFSGLDGIAYDEENCNVKGISGISFTVVPSDADLKYKNGVKSVAAGCLNVGAVSAPTTGKATFAFNANDPSEYITSAEGAFCVFRFAASENTKDYVADFTITDAKIRVTEWADWAEVAVNDYTGDQISITNGKYGEEATEPEVITGVAINSKPAVREGYNTYGVMATVNTADSKYVQVDFVDATKLLVVDLGTVIDNVPVTFGLNIMSVPAGTEIAIEENGVTAINELPTEAYVKVAAEAVTAE